jgi:pentatricopeptide repeat protein
MEALGVKPNVKTYTTLIHGWACASLPEKALRCFEEMKLAGLKPDKAVYHCLMTSLLSRATVAEAYIYSGILSICREMIESELTVDMGTAVYWSKCLRKIEGTGGELTEALQKTFPPDWNAHHSPSPEANYESGIESDIDDEPSNDGDNNMFLAGVNDGDSDDDIDDHDENKDFKQRLWV